MSADSTYTAEKVAKLLGPDLLQALESQSKQSKWSLERQGKLLKASHLGFKYGTASAYAGISRQTLTNWHRDYPQLKTLFEEAAAGGCMELARRLEKEEDDHQVTRWRLERQSDDHAPPVKRTETTISPPVQIELVETDAQGDAVPVPPEISGEEVE